MSSDYINDMQTRELDDLRNIAFDCALKLYEQGAIDQLRMLKDYVEVCLLEAKINKRNKAARSGE